MKHFYTLVYIMLAFLVNQVNAQSRVFDSLNLIANSAKNDTVRINALFAMDDLIYISDPETDSTLNVQIERICKNNFKKKHEGKSKLFYMRAYARTQNNLGIIFANKGNHSKALGYYFKGLKIRTQLKDLKNIAGSLNNIGSIYNEQGNNFKALEYYSKALGIREKLHDKQGIANTLISIGIIYGDQKDFSKAIEYFERALGYAVELNNLELISSAYNNMGVVYRQYKQFSKALNYYEKSLALRRRLYDRQGIAACFNNMGDIYRFEKMYEKAMVSYDSALVLSQAIGDETGISTSLTNKGIIYNMLHDYSNAVSYCEQGLKLAKKNGIAGQTRAASEVLYMVYKITGKFKESLKMKELFVSINDSLTSVESGKELIRYEFKHLYGKKAAADSVYKAEQHKLTMVTIAKEQTQRYILYGGIAMAIVFGIFIFNRLRITRKQKNIIEDQKKIVELQKELVEEKQREVLDSIRYARRIQVALLPQKRYLEKYLKKE